MRIPGHPGASGESKVNSNIMSQSSCLEEWWREILSHACGYAGAPRQAQVSLDIKEQAVIGPT